MTIEIKLINSKNQISTINLEDDPSDAAIANILGVSDTLCRNVFDWEIHYTPESKDILIIGKAPSISADIKKRKSCNLDDEAVLNIKKLFSDNNNKAGC